MNSIDTPYIYSFLRIIIILTILAGCTQRGSAQDLFPVDQTKVREALQQWTEKLPKFDKNKPTVLFATSTVGCAPCCASAINNAITKLEEKGVDANVLVVVATPIPKEGLALRKKFKTRNVSEDTASRLQTIFRAHLILPDIYFIGTNNDVLLYRHDLQHNPLNDPDLDHYPFSVKTTEGPVISPPSSVKLQEDDDNILTEVKSQYLDLKQGTLEVLETKQNAIYRFDIFTGELLKVIPADESLAFHFKKPGDRDDWWKSLLSNYSTMVHYKALINPRHSDTSYILATMFVGYTLEIDTSKAMDTTVSFDRGSCILKMFHDSIISVSAIQPSEWYVTGEPVAIGGELLAQCVWEGASDKNATPAHRRDSLYTFLRIRQGTYQVRPAVNTARLEEISGRPFNPRYPGLTCADGKGNLFYINMMNGIFFKAGVSADSIDYSIIPVGGALTDSKWFRANSADGRPSERDSIIVADIATNDRDVHVLVVNVREAERAKGGQMQLQTYTSAGKYVGEITLPTDADPVMSASIIGYNDKEIFLLTKQKAGRWKIVKGELPR